MALPELKVRVTGDAKGGKNALERTARNLERVEKQSVRTGGAVSRMASGIDRSTRRMSQATSASRNFGRGIQNAAFQVGDFAVQVGAGTGAVRAMAMQLPQLLGGFGVIGALAGAAAAIVGGLAANFLTAGDSAKVLGEAMKSVGEETEDLQNKLDLLRSGLGSIEELRLQEQLNNLLAQRSRQLEALEAFEAGGANNRADQARANLAGLQAEINTLREKLDALRDVRKQLSEEEAAVRRNMAAYRLYGESRAQSEQQISTRIANNYRLYADTRMEANKLASEIGQAATNALALAGVDITSPISSANRAAAQLAANLGISLNAAISLQNLQSTMEASGGRGGDPRTSNQQGYGRFTYNGPALDPFNNPLAAGGGGGGSATGNMSERLEALVGELQTEREIVEAWYQESLLLLQDANAAELEALGGHNEARLRLEQEYQDRLKDLRSGYHGDGLSQAQTFFGDMANAMQSGNEKMLKVAKVFGAAEALIDAWKAYNKVLADPSLPWFARIPAAVSVLSAGLGAVNAIRGVNSSAGGAAGGGAAANANQAPQQTNQYLNFNVVGQGRIDGRQIVELINEAVTDGARIAGVTVN